ATEKSTWRPCSSALATATCRSGSVSKPGSVGCIAPRPDWPLLAAWFKSWVFQVTVRTVPCLDGGGSFCRRTDSRLRNAGSGSSPACLTGAGGVGLSAVEREFFLWLRAMAPLQRPVIEEELQSAQIISDPLAAAAKVAP